jgi:hypothetical protein
MTKSDEYFDSYNKFMNASRQASHYAHTAAVNALNQLSLDSTTEDVFFKTEKKKTKKVKKSDVEFEITDELLQFYQESLKFKQEKGSWNFENEIY